LNDKSYSNYIYKYKMKEWNDEFDKKEEISSSSTPRKNLIFPKDKTRYTDLNLFFASRFKHFNSERIARFIYIDRLLYNFAGAKYSVYTPQNINRLQFGILQLMNFGKNKGFLNLSEFFQTRFIELSFTLFPQLKEYGIRDGQTAFNQLNITHFNNFCLLWLIKELTQLELNTKIEYQLELFHDLMALRNRLINILSPGIRHALLMHRFRVKRSITSGFDTEYKSVELGKNKLLASSQSLYPRSFLQVKKLESTDDIQWGINFESRESQLKPVSGLMWDVYMMIMNIRHLNDRSDDVASKLITVLQTRSDIKYHNDHRGHLFSMRKPLSPNSFINIFTDYTDINTTTVYSLESLVDRALLECQVVLDKELKTLMGIIDSYGFGKIFVNSNLKTIKFSNRRVRRTTDIVLLAHYTAADVSLWADFEDVKNKLRIIGKSFLTLERGIKLDKFKSTTIYLRDTSSLTPGGKSLKDLGELYTEEPMLRKIDLSQSDYRDMEQLMIRDPVLFKRYAILDSIISLYHGLKVEESSYELSDKLAIPGTLSSLAGSIIESKINFSKFSPEVVNPLYGITNISKLMTPKGVELTGNVAQYLPYFLGSYHGGRNESYGYGIFKGAWYDFDLPGAYPTALSLLAYPNYKAIKLVEGVKGEMLKDSHELLNSYSAFFVSFEFPDSVKFPCIPVRLDDSSVIFPSTGMAYCTGMEVSLAIKLGCYIYIISGYIIPFVNIKKEEEDRIERRKLGINGGAKYVLDKNIVQEIKKIKSELEEELLKVADLSREFIQNLPTENTTTKISSSTSSLSSLKSTKLVVQDKKAHPFLETHGFERSDFFLLMELFTKERSKHAKKTYNNVLYKFLANSGIGQLARGLARKETFNPAANMSTVIPSGTLTNPLYAGWVTSFIRCVLSEMINKLCENGFTILSSTTDGYITNCAEPTVYFKDLTFSEIFRIARANLKGLDISELQDSPEVLLEQKFKEGEGIISWTTRGQLGIESPLKAMTGFQANKYSHSSLVKLITTSFENDKVIRYLQVSLRSATDIYKHGGSVTGKYLEKDFSLKFDNRRKIDSSNFDVNFKAFISEPWLTVEECRTARYLESLDKKKYSPTSYLIPADTISTKTTFEKTFIRMLIRAYYHNNSIFKSESFNGIIMNRKFIQLELLSFNIKVSLNYITKQKSIAFLPNSVPQVDITKNMMSPILLKYPDFDTQVFFMS